MFVYHFVYHPCLRVEIFFKKAGAAKNGRCLETGLRHFCTLVLRVEENFMRSQSFVAVVVAVVVVVVVVVL